MIGTRAVAAASPGPSTQRPGTRALAVGVVVGLATTVAVGLLASPWIGIPLALLLVVMAPTSDRLDRRLAINLSLVAGWLPAVLWVPPFLGPGTAAGLGLGLATGLVAGSAASAPHRLMPTAARRDTVIAVAAGLAAVIAWPLRSPGSADRTLAMLSTGIDHGYHFSIFLERRLSAAGSGPLAVQADSSGFAFAEYPQWFHRMLTVLSQVVHGDPGSATTELARYAQLEWVVFIGVTVLVTSALLQALPVRAPATLVVPAVVLVLGLWLGVPGAVNLIQGHLSFLLAATAPAVVLLLLAPVSHRLRPLTLAAVAGLLLVAASWMLLLPLAATAVLAPFAGLWRRPPPVLRRAGLAVGAALAVAAFLFVRPWLGAVGLQAVLTDGTIPRLHLWALVAVLVGVVVLVEALRRRAPHELDLLPHIVVTLVSLLQLVVLGGYMLAEVAELRYYFWKLALGSLLVSLLVAALALVTALDARTPRPTGSRRARLTSLVACLVAAVGVGPFLQEVAAPSAGWAAIVPISLAQRPATDDAGDVDLVLRLAEATAPAAAARTRLVATRPDDMNTGHALVWFHALSHSATHRAMDENTLVYELAEEPDDTSLAMRIAEETLAAPDRRVMVTDPDLYAAVVAAVAPEDARRVVLAR
ncbi:hypothetical protein [Oryzobacter terrae]|uniref:hypothetical protein n=1 Tax=Oryzobacter terrae TaxID=1620385 RepID=UPI00366B955C